MTTTVHTDPEIILHWLDHSRSQRILHLLHELSLPYTLTPHLRTPTLSAPASTLALHPLGKLPLLTINTTLLAESSHITSTLITRYGPHLAPTEESAHLLYQQLLHYAEGSLITPFLVRIITRAFIADEADAGFVKKVEENWTDAQIVLQYEYIEGLLAEGGGWLCGGKFTGADLLCAWVLEEAWKAEVCGVRGYAGIAGWLEKVRGREAYKTALKETEELEKKGVDVKW